MRSWPTATQRPATGRRNRQRSTKRSRAPPHSLPRRRRRHAPVHWPRVGPADWRALAIPPSRPNTDSLRRSTQTRRSSSRQIDRLRGNSGRSPPSFATGVENQRDRRVAPSGSAPVALQQGPTRVLDDPRINVPKVLPAGGIGRGGQPAQFVLVALGRQDKPSTPIVVLLSGISAA